MGLTRETGLPASLVLEETTPGGLGYQLEQQATISLPTTSRWTTLWRLLLLKVASSEIHAGLKTVYTAHLTALETLMGNVIRRDAQYVNDTICFSHLVC